MLDRITVCKPIHFSWDHVATARGDRRALVLTDVAYVLDAHIAQACDVAAEDRALGAAHLGLADYPADVRLLTGPEPTQSSLSGTGRIDLGWMTYDNNQSRIRFFRASMLDGVIAVGLDERLELAS